MQFITIFIVASFVCASLALSVERVDSEKADGIIEIDDFLEMGCKVVNETKLYYDDIFIRELNKNEQNENKKYEKALKAFDEAYEKAHHHGEKEFKLDVEYPELPKFCDGLDKIDLGDCYALGGKLYKDNKKLRDLSEKEKKQVDDYAKILYKYFEDVYAEWDEDFDVEKVMADKPKGPQLCN